jgi:DNA replication protein DnaC
VARSAKSTNVVDLTKNASSYPSKYSSGSAKNATASVSTAPSFASNSHKEPDKPHIEPSTLNSDQTVAATKIFAGSNAFLTGAAGVGKSYLLNY